MHNIKIQILPKSISPVIKREIRLMIRTELQYHAVETNLQSSEINDYKTFSDNFSITLAEWVILNMKQTQDAYQQQRHPISQFRICGLGKIEALKFTEAQNMPE